LVEILETKQVDSEELCSLLTSSVTSRSLAVI